MYLGANVCLRRVKRSNFSRVNFSALGKYVNMASNLNKLTKAVFIENISESRRFEGDITNFDFDKSICRILSRNEEISDDSKGVMYWMCRDCRVQDNWALLFSQRLALKNKLPLLVCFFADNCRELYPTRRQFKFLTEGLKCVKNECEKLNINFYLIKSSPEEIPAIVKNNNIGTVVSDFFPLRKPREWKENILKKINVCFVEVDAHNIVPAWITSDKQESAARTIRPKITKKLDQYLVEFPEVKKHPYPGKIKVENEITDFDQLVEDFKPDIVKEVSWAKGGPENGLEMLHSFLVNKLQFYGECSNDPSKEAVSNISPWIHFGQISAQRCALEVKKIKLYKNQTEKFLEELIVRKELSDNFCYYNPNYDNIEGADPWARKTLNQHRHDKRIYIYTKQQFENAKTHDDIWNCAQLELLQYGKIHGYMRMYWCKKILEWTKSPEEAIEFALYLNDTYSLDGSDPNGFVGVMWSICGIHDHGWKEREVFGKIRFMVDYSLRNKFDIDAYCAKFGKKLPLGKSVKKSRKRKASTTDI